MKKHYFLAAAFFLFLVIASGHSFADSEMTGPECEPGFNATLAKVRAIQRASSCAATGSLGACKIQMGVGLLAIEATASARGKGLSSKVAGAIRDINSRPCPFVASRERFSLLFLEPAYAAGCTPQLEIERARIQKSMDVIAEEIAKQKTLAEETLKTMQKTVSEIEAAPAGPEQTAKINSIAKKSVADARTATQTAFRDYEAARTRLNYGAYVSAESEAQRLKESKFFEFRKAFKTYFGVAYDAEELYDLNSMSEKLNPAQKKHMDELRATLKQASSDEFSARNAMRDIDRDPTVQKLNARLEATNKFTVELNQLSDKPAEYAKSLSAKTNELKASMGKLEKAQQAMSDFKSALGNAKTGEDLYALASRLHNFIPKESLLDPAMKTIATALREASVVGEQALRLGGKMSEPILSLLSKYPALGELAAGGRAVGGLVLRGVAMTGGLLVSGLTFAEAKCDRTMSKVLPRSPKNECEQDLSPDSAVATKIFEMEPTAMCQLMKENPDVKDMVELNYSQSYPNTRAQCGNPMTFAIEGRGQVRFDGKTATVLRPGDSRETIVQFDENGVESAIKFPKMIRGGGWETLKPGESPMVGAGDRFDRFTHDYRTQILPMIAETSACCSGEGVTPTTSECSRYGINTSSGNTNTRSGTSPSGTGTIRK